MARSNSIKSSRPNQDNHRDLRDLLPNLVRSGQRLQEQHPPPFQSLLRLVLELGLRVPLPR